MLQRRQILAASAGALPAHAIARAEDMPGVTATEIRIGNTMSYSGPVSGLGIQGKTIDAYFDRVTLYGMIIRDGRRL